MNDRLVWKEYFFLEVNKRKKLRKYGSIELTHIQDRTENKFKE